MADKSDSIALLRDPPETDSRVVKVALVEVSVEVEELPATPETQEST